MKRIVVKSFIIIMLLSVGIGNIQAKSKKVRHEYPFYDVIWTSDYDWYSKKLKLYTKIKGNKIIVKGKGYITHHIDSGQDIDPNTAKSLITKLKKKKRTYIITKKTKFYSLHWTSKTKMSKKNALKCIKKRQYGGFQVYIKNNKILELYLLNHGM